MVNSYSTEMIFGQVDNEGVLWFLCFGGRLGPEGSGKKGITLRVPRYVVIFDAERQLTDSVKVKIDLHQGRYCLGHDYPS